MKSYILNSPHIERTKTHSVCVYIETLLSLHKYVQLYHNLSIKADSIAYAWKFSGTALLPKPCLTHYNASNSTFLALSPTLLTALSTAFAPFAGTLMFKDDVGGICS